RGSVNQIVPSDLTAISFGEFRRRPACESTRVVMVPSYSVRKMHRFLMQAGDQASVPVACLAVGIVGWLAINRNAFGFGPTHNTITRQISEQEAIPISHPYETFYPAEARG